jgi:putative transposase
VAEKRLLLDREDVRMSLRRQAEILGMARSSIYVVPSPVSQDTLNLQNAIDRIYTRLPFYGTRRILREIRTEYGILAGRARIRSTMRALGLQTLYTKPKTSTPHPDHRIYPYLLRRITAAHPNHIWGTDITYIPLAHGFAYLVALLDWYSRYVLAWTLSPTMECGFCVRNLERAIKKHGTPRIHNSDQGSQFTANAYCDMLRSADIQISMDGRGRCLDNIFTERLWRTVKYEDVYLKRYDLFQEAEEGLNAYFRFYNEKRPHQSLNYKTPSEVYFGETKKLYS